MSNTIKLKRGSGSDPGASDLVVGEVAVRTDTGCPCTNQATCGQCRCCYPIRS